MGVPQIAGRAAEAAGWALVAGVGVVMLTQALGRDVNRVVAALQALTPYALPALLVVLAIASLSRRVPLAAAAATLVVSVLVLVVSVVAGASTDRPPASDVELRAASVNLLFSNDRVDEVADDLLERDLDVVVFHELTPAHARDLRAHRLAARYPHRVDLDRVTAGGMAIWSVHPFADEERRESIARTIDTVVVSPDGPIRVLAVHPSTPIHDHGAWTRDLRLVARSVERSSGPILVIGDFNATWWNPVMRRVLDTGLVDAHVAHGRWFSASWPTDRWFPPFVRLDHALTGGGLVSTGVEDFAIPGSDHRGFAVSVSLSRSPS
ncbi:endonuclease/exonuclease/phosphatase family protein [Ilumatobacter sp.]|uniref:endonuclease/exonuclease/phosphatase family protein n=1 Tax=Ilumatobacter sp. TaxID=1967498 RepID=UPI003B52A8AF